MGTDSLRIVSSTNGAIWRARGLTEWLPRWSQVKDVRLVCYHENTLDLHPLTSIEQKPPAEYLDLLECDHYARQIIEDPRWQEWELKKDWNSRYYCKHGSNWFRKVSAIRCALLSDPSDIVWADMDVTPRLRFTAEVVQAMLSRADLWYIDREKTRFKVTDTGFIIFKNNEGTKRFVESWWELYRSGEIFATERWADHYALDLIRSRMPHLKYGKLLDARFSRSIVKHQLGHIQMAKLRKGG